MSNALILTHIDLDGVSAAIAISRFLPVPSTWEIKYCDYDTIDKQVEKMLNKDLKENPELQVFITDICPLAETCEKIDAAVNAGAKISLYDHHKTRQWVSKYPWAHFDLSVCGAMVVSNHMGHNADTHFFYSAVDAWDLWKLTSQHRKRGERLSLIWNALGNEAFFNIFFANLNADQEKPWVDIIQALENKRDSTVNKIIEKRLTKAQRYFDDLGNIYLVIFTEEYTSEVGHQTLMHEDCEDLKYVVVCNPIGNTVSLRSREGEVDVSVIAKKLGGGGHAAAAGFPLNMLEHIERQIYSVLNRLDTKK